MGYISLFGFYSLHSLTASTGKSTMLLHTTTTVIRRKAMAKWPQDLIEFSYPMAAHKLLLTRPTVTDTLLMWSTKVWPCIPSTNPAAHILPQLTKLPLIRQLQLTHHLLTRLPLNTRKFNFENCSTRIHDAEIVNEFVVIMYREKYIYIDWIALTKTTFGYGNSITCTSYVCILKMYRLIKLIFIQYYYFDICTTNELFFNSFIKCSA
jgi:hypothetical protein